LREKIVKSQIRAKGNSRFPTKPPPSSSIFLLFDSKRGKRPSRVWVGGNLREQVISDEKGHLGAAWRRRAERGTKDFVQGSGGEPQYWGK